MNILASIIFTLFLFIWTAFIPILFSVCFITRNAKTADYGAFIWSKVALWMLKTLCGIDHEVLDADKLPKEPCIIACKHQSMWETIVMHLVLQRPVYGFKKELLKIPFYGWYIRIMSGITIDRKGGAGALKSLVRQSKSFLEKGQNIVIFPQGTRTPVGAKVADYPYQAGIAALYLACGVKVVPMALNSGKFWPKKGMSKKPGVIKLRVLDAIEPGLKKKEFMAKLEEVVENGCDAL